MLQKESFKLCFQEGRQRIPAWHPHWSGHFLLCEAGEIILEQQSSKGKFLIEDNELHIQWENWASEIYVWVHGAFVLKRAGGETTNEELAKQSLVPPLICFVREDYNRNEALHRVQSEPLIRGLQDLGVNVAILPPNSQFDQDLVRGLSYVIFHYNSSRACEISLEIKKISNCKAACLASDIYNLRWYTDLSDWVDIFIAPTKLHKDLLSYATNKPVVYLPECVDCIALPMGGPSIPVQKNERVCWFGYPESFDKSLGLIVRNLALRHRLRFRDFAIISNHNDQVMPGAEHFQFDASTFYQVVSRFGYTLLSHLPFDMHFNSYIKSPNKLVTSIVRGLVPIFSASPSYDEISRKYDLEHLQFKNADELGVRLEKLDVLHHTYNDRLSSAARNLSSELSPVKVASALLSFIL